MIFDLVQAEGLDPWDIDIISLANYYVKKIEKMQTLDFRLPAQILLVAAILLRMKAETLALIKELIRTEEVPKAPVEEIEPINLPEDFEIPAGEVQRLPSRKITLPELIDAVQSILKDIKKNESSLLGGGNGKAALEDQELMKEIPITEQMNILFGKIKKVMSSKSALSYIDSKGYVTFDSLLDTADPLAVIEVFIPLLHLACDHRICLYQEQIFDKLYVSLVRK